MAVSSGLCLLFSVCPRLGAEGTGGSGICFPAGCVVMPASTQHHKPAGTSVGILKEGGHTLV